MTDTPTMSEAAVKPSSVDVARVVRDGVVSVARRAYTHPIFLELEGRKVGLRPVENSANELHVFVDGRWAGDAGRVGLPDTPIEHHPAIRYQEDEQRSLGGARLVETENFILCDHAVAAGAEDLEMVACYGEAGLGKSYATERAARAHAKRLGMRHLHIKPRQSMSGPAFVGALLGQLFGIRLMRNSVQEPHWALLLDAP